MHKARLASRIFCVEDQSCLISSPVYCSYVLFSAAYMLAAAAKIKSHIRAREKSSTVHSHNAAILIQIAALTKSAIGLDLLMLLDASRKATLAVTTLQEKL